MPLCGVCDLIFDGDSTFVLCEIEDNDTEEKDELEEETELYNTSYTLVYFNINIFTRSHNKLFVSSHFYLGTETPPPEIV